MSINQEVVAIEQVIEVLLLKAFKLGNCIINLLLCLSLLRLEYLYILETFLKLVDYGKHYIEF